MPTFTRISIGLILLTLTSCATILSKSNWPVYVQTNPEGAKVEIWNRKGVEIYNARTPTVLKLRSGSGYFGKEFYTVKLSLEGYESRTINLECKINGWYFGNILLGGVLGMVVIDPLTGAMYRLETDNVYETLSSKPLSEIHASPILFIAKRNEIKLGLHNHLVEVVPAADLSKLSMGY